MDSRAPSESRSCERGGLSPRARCKARILVIVSHKLNQHKKENEDWGGRQCLGKDSPGPPIPTGAPLWLDKGPRFPVSTCILQMDAVHTGCTDRGRKLALPSDFTWQPTQGGPAWLLLLLLVGTQGGMMSVYPHPQTHHHCKGLHLQHPQM